MAGGGLGDISGIAGQISNILGSAQKPAQQPYFNTKPSTGSTFGPEFSDWESWWKKGDAVVDASEVGQTYNNAMNALDQFKAQNPNPGTYSGFWADPNLKSQYDSIFKTYNDATMPYFNAKEQWKKDNPFTGQTPEVRIPEDIFFPSPSTQPNPQEFRSPQVTDTSREAYNQHMSLAFYMPGTAPSYEQWVQQQGSKIRDQSQQPNPFMQQRGFNPYQQQMMQRQMQQQQMMQAENMARNMGVSPYQQGFNPYQQQRMTPYQQQFNPYRRQPPPQNPYRQQYNPYPQMGGWDNMQPRMQPQMGGLAQLLQGLIGGYGGGMGGYPSKQEYQPQMLPTSNQNDPYQQYLNSRKNMMTMDMPMSREQWQNSSLNPNRPANSSNNIEPILPMMNTMR